MQNLNGTFKIIKMVCKQLGESGQLDMSVLTKLKEGCEVVNQFFFNLKRKTAFCVCEGVCVCHVCILSLMNCIKIQ